MDEILRLAGMLLLIATGLTVAAAFLAGVYAVGRDNRRLLRNAIVVAVAAPLLHALLIAAGPLLTRKRVLAASAELSFCGFDCHLHVSARRDDAPGVVVLRFRSDARAVPEHPGWLRVRGQDADGVAHEPLGAIPDTPLAAGDTVEHAVRFAPGVRIDRVVITWRDWDRYLVPGPGNPLVQARVSLDLDEAPTMKRGAGT